MPRRLVRIVVLFNGVANQYQDHPPKVGTGERVRIFVLNAGPSVDSSFHIVGTIFYTVRKEGVALSRDNPGIWGSQAMDLSPAQGDTSNSSPPKTACTRSSPMPSTLSSVEPSASFRLATATPRTDPTPRSGLSRPGPDRGRSTPTPYCPAPRSGRRFRGAPSRAQSGHGTP